MKKPPRKTIEQMSDVELIYALAAARGLLIADLSPEQRRVVRGYILSGDVRDAAKRAKMKPGAAQKLLERPDVARLIALAAEIVEQAQAQLAELGLPPEESES